jgi:hypothetical protein
MLSKIGVLSGPHGCNLTPERSSVEVLGQEVAQMTAQPLTAFRHDYLGFIFQTFPALSLGRLTLRASELDLARGNSSPHSIFH